MTERQKPSIGLTIVCCVLLVMLFALIGLAAFGAENGDGGLPSGGASASGMYTGVTTLYIETSSADVILTPSRDNVLRTNLPNSSNIEVYYDGESGDLWIEQRGLRRGFPFFSGGETVRTIRIEVPYVPSIGVETASGNIEADIPGASGLHLATDSGSIFLSGADITGEITASTSSGDIDMRSFYSDSVYITSDSGPVRLDEVYCADISVFTESGTQRIAPMMGAQLNLMSGSGDVYLYPAQSLLGSVYTRNGSVSLRTINSPQSVLFSTQSGNAHLSRGDIFSAPPDSGGAVRYDVEGQGPQLDVSTQSGNLIIE